MYSLVDDIKRKREAEDDARWWRDNCRLQKAGMAFKRSSAVSGVPQLLWDGSPYQPWNRTAEWHVSLDWVTDPGSASEVKPPARRRSAP